MKALTRYGIQSHRVIPAFVSVAAVCVIAACSRTTEMSDVAPAGGFLPRPALLQPGQSGQPALIYRSPQLTSGGYNKIILDPVTIWTDESSNLLTLPPEQQQGLAENFHARVYEALSKECQMVTSADPNTIRIRLALIDAQQSHPALNTISTYIPQAHVASTLAAFAFNQGAGIFAGSASAESYATDSKTGALLWEAVDKRAGQNALGTNTLNSWQDVDNAFVAWSTEFANRLKTLGICKM